MTVHNVIPVLTALEVRIAWQSCRVRKGFIVLVVIQHLVNHKSVQWATIVHSNNFKQKILMGILSIFQIQLVLTIQFNVILFLSGYR